ncbi:Protein AATF [Cryptotermes secundus]|uniref:Protein AATF n=1 Tax=Cryptotermes secundus TaxID=105785 RepID=A0A2J7Q9N0_9NEOP|nr:protein AATF [Cryptotermes secundus]PNF25298.1 Protein AATF [Cryptotermes secundus]
MVEMGTKKSLSECFSDLINPAPASFDPEDDIYPDTVAKVVENNYEFSDEETRQSTLRKRSIDAVDGDERYDGAKISRKALRMQGTGDKLELGKEDCSETEDAYTSEDDEESDENQEDTHVEMDRNEMLQPRDNEGESIFQHISSRGMETDVERGIGVRNQLNLWDSLLECRIQLQKALTAANKLPQYNIFEHFIAEGGSKFKAEVQQTKNKITTLLENMIAFQTEMLKSYPETRNLYKTNKKECSTSEVDETYPVAGEEEEEEEEENYSSDGSELQKQKELDTKHHNLEHYAELISDHHRKYSEYRNATIQLWNDRTRVLVGKLNSHNFSNFEHSTLKQIEQILSNRQRLIQRSQLKRQSFIILGQQLVPQQQQQESTEGAVTYIDANNLKTDQEQCREYYTEIYDDTDYYHQLLRELIERKSSDVTDPVQLGRQWLELQKLRSKMKRKMDTRATKGRKIRYVVHSKLVNYMAPVSQNLYTEEAKTELYNSLFRNGGRQ